MKLARVSKTLIGNIIKESVFSVQGNLLLKEGAIIDSNVLKKLAIHDIDFIYVIESLIQDIEPYSIIEEKKLNESVNVVENVFKDVMEQERMGIKACIPKEHLTLVKEIIEELLIELKNAEDILYTIVDLISTDEYTYKHSVHVTVLSIIIAKKLNYSRRDIRNIALGALLHDIGKVRVDINLILKPDKLTDDEYDLVRKHPEFGYELLEAVDELPYSTRQIIRHHHEKLDGSGYPLGLKGIEIPEYVRIVTVCDIYDAMTTDRVYRKKMPIYRALDILMTESVSKIDSNICNIMLTNIAIYPVGTGVIISDGSIGIVVSYRNVNPARPKIRVLTNNGRSNFISMQEINLEDSPVLFITDTWDVELLKNQKSSKEKDILENKIIS